MKKFQFFSLKFRSAQSQNGSESTQTAIYVLSNGNYMSSRLGEVCFSRCEEKKEEKKIRKENFFSS